MKKITFILLFFFSFSIITPSASFAEEEAPTAPLANDLAVMRDQGYVGDTILGGFWEVDENSPYTVFSVDQNSSRTWLVSSGLLPETNKRISYGGALNLKYHTGLSYDYLQKNIKGKTISVDVLVPKGALSSSKVIPNKLRVSLKSERNGEWADYYGDAEWTNVREEGLYGFSLTVPEEPIEYDNRNTFYPDNSILFAIDYFLMEGSANNSSVINYSFFNFKIDGMPIDPASLKWQFTENGYADTEKYLPEFPKSSTFINAMGSGIDLDYRDMLPDNAEVHKFSGPLKDFFLTLAVFIPEELRQQKGTLALTLKDDAGRVRSSVKNFSSCNLEGKVFLTLQLDPFTVQDAIENLGRDSSIRLRIKTTAPHTQEMLPIVLEPIQIKQGRLVPFNEKWDVRDPQGLGAYPELEITQNELLTKSGIGVKDLSDGSYQMDTIMMLKGGIDWLNPYYKVELVKEYAEPVNLDNMHLEVIMSPLTDTTDVWQKPFRGRIGLIDAGGNLMFGPNVSLSEGLSNMATLEVSTTNPIPKGLVTPGFDPHKVKAIVINIEASHARLEPREIRISFINLAITPREYTRTSPLKVIDFSKFKRDIASWELTKMLTRYAGYLVGINYPFPVIDVPENIMKVPQIYPCVGQKSFDIMHFGFGSPITKETAIRDFKTFSASNITLVRLLMLGHLEGVYTFDEQGRDISGFGEGMESLVQETAGMSVEKLTEFLNKNEDSFFLKTDTGTLKGLEKHVYEDFVALLDVLETVEKETGKRLMVSLALYDFLLGDGATKEGPLRMFEVGEHPEVVIDPLTKVKAQALLWKLMKQLSQDERFYRYVAMIEIMNEPANATLLSTRKHFIDLLNFVGEGMYLVKDAIGPKIPVSVGFRSWPGDLRYWAPISEGLDVLNMHYWESLESYNIDTPGLWPLDMPVRELWKALGTKADGRPTGMGEISPGGDITKNLNRLEDAGYDFALLWSYSGHDGHNAKPVMREIADYQAANRKIARLRGKPRETLEASFEYMKSARRNFETGALDVKDTDADFFAYLASKVRPDNLDRIEDTQIRRTVAEVLLISMFKKMSLTPDNIKSLEKKVLKQ